MSSPPFPPLVELRQTGWDSERIAAVERIAAPNNECVARAALARLAPQDHIAPFGAWCDRRIWNEHG